MSACAAPPRHPPGPRVSPPAAEVRAWAEQLASKDADVRAEAIDRLHRMGPEAIGLLAEMLGDGRAENRRVAVDLLVDLTPETQAIQPQLQRALRDGDVIVARDSARALGALGERVSGESVGALVEALASHPDPHVRLYAAEALASIGPAASEAVDALAKALGDDFPGVRWGACEALASIGADSAAAVPQLVHALEDDYLYVRICAAGALGGIGRKADAAVNALKQAAAKDPAMQGEVKWALERISADQSAAADAVPEVSTSLERTPLQPEPAGGNPPSGWDTKTERNITWSVELGDETLGRPVVAGGVVYVGTDNRGKRDKTFTDECGVLAAFRASDGAFLWQDVAPRVSRRGLGEFLLPSTTSAPYVDGERLYYVTAECQLRCLDARTGERVWELDMCARLGVFPHEASNSDVLPVGELLIVCTSNGRNEGHTRVPSPRAPSLIAVDKRSGNVVWRAVGAGADVLHGQWCSPVAADVGGRTQVLFGGGDGWLRAYDAASAREVWRFDGNPKDARYLPRPGVFSRSGIIASPVYDGSRVFVAMGDDPSHGDGPSLLHAVSPGGHGDVTDSRRIWTCRRVGRVVGTPIVNDGLLYVGDLGGRISCIDGATGALVWHHDTKAPIWGCLLVAGGRVYVGNVTGVMTVLRAGRDKELLAEIEMDSSLYARPALVGNALYLATARRLYLIEVRP